MFGAPCIQPTADIEAIVMPALERMFADPEEIDTDPIKAPFSVGTTLAAV